jgi:hypothetical protein
MVLTGQARMHREHVGREQDQADRREVLARAVGHAGEQVRRNCQGAHVDQQQGVAILLGLGDQVGADIAAGAGLVLDHDRLADGVLQLRADEARQDVRGPARRERHDDPDRLGEGLSRGAAGCEAQSENCESRNDAEPTNMHACLP